MIYVSGILYVAWLCCYGWVICAICYGVFMITCVIVGENAGTIIASPFILICAIAGVAFLILLIPIAIIVAVVKCFNKT